MAKGIYKRGKVQWESPIGMAPFHLKSRASREKFLASSRHFGFHAPDTLLVDTHLYLDTPMYLLNMAV